MTSPGLNFKRKGQGEWTPERRAQKAAEMRAFNYDPEFHVRKLAGLAKKLPRATAIPKHSHPVVKGLFVGINKEVASYRDISKRSGISRHALRNWKLCNMPQVDSLDAALNAVGFELAIVPIGSRDENGFVRKRAYVRRAGERKHTE